MNDVYGSSTTPIFARSLATLAFCLSLVLPQPAAYGVPMAPNESWVVAEVVEISLVDSTILNILPKQNLFRCQLRILKVEAIEGVENILRGHEGKTIEALARDPLGSGEVKGKSVRVRIVFQGDERRGNYWIVESAMLPRAQ